MRPMQAQERESPRNETRARVMDDTEARERFSRAAVARMATVDTAGKPHLVPTVFAVEGDRIYSLVDAKPKRSRHLKRISNIEANPRVALIVDHYTEDWTTLWWVRADGLAMVVAAGPLHDRAIQLLRAKYPQYGDQAMQFGPALIVNVDRWTGWSAAPSARRS